MSDFDFRDYVEELDPSLVPALRRFPVAKYNDILRAGKAAASTARYDDQEAASRDASNVVDMLKYYREFHPEMVPAEFGRRVWQSKEDGRWRWAIMPERQREWTHRS